MVTSRPTVSAQQVPTDKLPAGIPISIMITPTDGPELHGPKWVCIVFSDMLVSMSVRLPVDQMETVATELPQQIRDACAEARRINLGIALPNEP